MREYRHVVLFAGELKQKTEQTKSIKNKRYYTYIPLSFI